MLNENIKAIRKSQRAFPAGAGGQGERGAANRLEVGARAVGPDADMLLALSEALETPVSVLLGETVVEPEADTLQAISQKLEVINLQLARRKTTRRKVVRWVLISFCAC